MGVAGISRDCCSNLREESQLRGIHCKVAVGLSLMIFDADVDRPYRGHLCVGNHNPVQPLVCSQGLLVVL